MDEKDRELSADELLEQLKRQIAEENSEIESENDAAKQAAENTGVDSDKDPIGAEIIVPVNEKPSVYKLKKRKANNGENRSDVADLPEDDRIILIDEKSDNVSHEDVILPPDSDDSILVVEPDEEMKKAAQFPIIKHSRDEELTVEDDEDDAKFEELMSDDDGDFHVLNVNGENDDSFNLDEMMRKYLSEEEYSEYIAAKETKPVYVPNEATSTFDAVKKRREKEKLKTSISDAEDYVKKIAAEMPDPDKFDVTDLNLMKIFEMEDQIEEVADPGTVKELEKQLEEEQLPETEESFPESAFDENSEYTSFSQSRSVFSMYKQRGKRITTRLLLAFALLIVAFIYENISSISAAGALNLDKYPIVNLMIGLQLVIFGCALVWDDFKNGVKALIKLKPEPASIVSLILIVTVIYHIAMCFMYYRGSLALFDVPVILCVLAALVCEYLNFRRELYSFNIVSSKRMKFVVDSVDEENSRLETETFGEYMASDPTIFKIRRTNFVNGYFRRINGYGRGKAAVSAIIPIAVLAAAVCAFLSYYFTNPDMSDKLFNAVGMGYLTLLMMLPAVVFCAYCYPIYSASKKAFSMDSAIIGEPACEEYSRASAISFDDSDVFPSNLVKVRGIKVYGKNRIDRIIYTAASLFCRVGGPLCDVFEIATRDLGHSENVEIISIEDEGIEAAVDGSHTYVGTAAYIQSKGFTPIYDSPDYELSASGDTCIMFMASEGSLSAKMYIKYGIDPDFEDVLRQLYHSGMCVGIKTFDPNIDNALLSRYIKLSRYPVSILKCTSLDDISVTESSVDSGIISKKSAKALLKTLSLCERVKNTTKTNLVLKFTSVAIAAVIMVFFALKGNDAGSFSSNYVSLYQAFWIAATALISGLFI